MATKPSKQAMRGKGGRADVIDTAEGKAKRDAAIASLQGRRKVRVVRAPTVRRGANDNVMQELQAKIEERLVWAADVISRMSAGKGCYPSSAACGWPDIVRDYWESAKYSVMDIPRVIPSMTEFDAAIEVMRWLSKLQDRERKIVAAKAFGFSYRQIAKEFHCSYVTIRTEHRVGLLTLALTIKKTA